MITLNNERIDSGVRLLISVIDNVFHQLFSVMSHVVNHPLVTLVNDHQIMTFVVIVVIGLIWIYFQIPNIKAKTAPTNGVKSSRDEWTDVHKSMNRYSLILFSIGLVFAYGIWSYLPDGNNDPIPTFLYWMVSICFITSAIMQFMNKAVATMYINKQGESE